MGHFWGTKQIKPTNMAMLLARKMVSMKSCIWDIAVKLGWFSLFYVTSRNSLSRFSSIQQWFLFMRVRQNKFSSYNFLHFSFKVTGFIHFLIMFSRFYPYFIHKSSLLIRKFLLTNALSKYDPYPCFNCLQQILSLAFFYCFFVF